MALRATRGLLRLWLFSSVLWIGFVGVMTWLSLSTEPKLTPVHHNPFDQFDTAGKELPDAPW
jgi:hypothetical protein